MPSPRHKPAGSPMEVFWTFLRLGLTSFGGPVAHLGYFRRALIERRGWTSEADYAQIVAIAQFLPGPASSQVGFALGLTRAGFWGGVAAFAGFTLPSAALMLAFACLQPLISQATWGGALLHGLKLTAVAVVAQALWAMARSLCPDRARSGVAVGAGLVVMLLPVQAGQIAAIVLAGLAGLILCRAKDAPAAATGVLWTAPRATAPLCLILLAVLFIPGSPLASGGGAERLFHAFYRSGALVFGGGHVVLPLLRDQVVAPGWVTQARFLSGYGAAQAAPGPLFTFAAYLGAVSTEGPGGIGGAAIALAAIFLPGFLLMLAVLPHWGWLRRSEAAQSAVKGINAAVVGLLALAFYDPVWKSAVLDEADFAIAAAGFVLLTAWKAPPLAVVGLCLGAEAIRFALG